MRFSRTIQVLFVTSAIVWGQGGGRRGNAPAQTPANAPAQGTAGRGGTATPAATGPATSPVGFYGFDATAANSPAIPDTAPIETHQKVTVGGESIAYTARAGHLSLRNATTGLSEAHVFYTSYTKDGNDGPNRPICFFFGGAPGVSAAWQEAGGLGPKRLKLDGSGTPWGENPGTILGQTDLVFVNPVGTAYSRPDSPGKGPSFWNTQGDTASLGEFVRSYVNRNNRRTSPLFLAGEDLSTGRAGMLAAYLIEHQIPVHGVALFSMTMSGDSSAGDAQYLTSMPSLTMAAWAQKKLAPELNSMSAEQISAQARQFASREYLHALYKGDRMTADERTKAIANMSRLTGLSKQFIASNNLRVTIDRFNQELMRDQHKGMAMSDARVTGFLPAPQGGGRGGGGGFGVFGPAIDFNLSAISGDFLSAYEAYVRHELNFAGSSDGIYYLTSGGVNGYTSNGSDESALSSAFIRNPKMKLFVGVNYFDLNAPFYQTEFTLAHLNVSPEVRSQNIKISHYEAGQMPYMDNKELPKLQRDLANFVSGK